MSYSAQSLLDFQRINMNLYLTLYNLVSCSEIEGAQANLETIRSFQTNLVTTLNDSAGIASGAELIQRVPLLLQQQTQLLQKVQETALSTQMQLGSDINEAMSAWKASTIAAMEVNASNAPFNNILQKQLDSFSGLMSAWTSAFESRKQPRSGKR